MRQQRPAAAPGRSGFTLVEMLVVLAILVLLASLSAAGIVRWLATQSQDTTGTTMRGVLQAMHRQLQAGTGPADKEDPPAPARNTARPRQGRGPGDQDRPRPQQGSRRPVHAPR